MRWLGRIMGRTKQDRIHDEVIGQEELGHRGKHSLTEPKKED